jgi:hypothetical protein
MPTNKPFIPNAVVRWIVALLALAAVLGFAVIFGIAISKVISAKDGMPPKADEAAFVYVATGLATLVGGIVAVGFGVPMPKPPDPPPAPGLAPGPASKPSLVIQASMPWAVSRFP